MIKIENNKFGYKNLFNEYRHNVPVIFSSLEGQYAGELFVNNEVKCEYAFLATPFDYYFVAGNPKSEGAVEGIDKLLFYQLLKKREKKEAVVFCPNEQWFSVLNEIFGKHNGLKDGRKVFSLNLEKFMKIRNEIKLDNEVHIELCYEHDNGSAIDYPVCRVFKNNTCVGFCSAFMIGKNHAELDVFTEAEFRKNGYAKLTSITLISELLEKNIIPVWCTWPYRIESQILAKAIGFEQQEDVQAYIWVEEACGKL